MSQRLEDIARRAEQTQQRLSNPGSGSSSQGGSTPQPHQFEQIVRDLYRLQNDVSRIVSQIEQFTFGSQPSYGQPPQQSMSPWASSSSAESETRQAVAELASTTSELAREVGKVAVRS